MDNSQTSPGKLNYSGLDLEKESRPPVEAGSFLDISFHRTSLFIELIEKSGPIRVNERNGMFQQSQLVAWPEVFCPEAIISRLRYIESFR